MINRMLLSGLLLLLTAGAAAAQSPIAGGRQHQPTQQEIASRGIAADREWSQSTQSEIDRLYDEIMRAAGAPPQR